MTHHRPRIVILGGGFAGIAAAKRLGLSLRTSAHIMLIDKQPVHVFTPLLYEVATAFTEHESLGSAHLYRSGVAVEYGSVLSRFGVDFIQDTVTGIDWERKKIRRENGMALHFDYVIIALGSETHYYGIEGLEAGSYPLKIIRDADRIRQRVHDLLHKTETGKKDRFDILIGGAGATGVELATELTLFLRKHLMKGHVDASEFRIAIVEAQSSVLPLMASPFSEWAEDRIRSFGVSLYLDTRIQRVHGTQVMLACRDIRPNESVESLRSPIPAGTESVVNADILVWTGGVRGSHILETLSVPLDDRGKRIPIHSDLSIPGREQAFAVGDSALLMNPQTQLPVPWLAQAAIRQGDHVARNIIRDLQSLPRLPFSDFSYPVIVTLGGKYGIARIGRFRLQGPLVWILRVFADFRYFFSILPVHRALWVWWRGIRVYAQND